MRRLLPFIALFTLSACAFEHGAFIQQSDKARHVRASMMPPAPDCHSLGLVSGRESSSTMVMADEHIRRATMAATEEVAARGGNYFLMQGPLLHTMQMGATGATVLG